MPEFTKPGWISNHQNLIITGATGVGKTYPACAIGNVGCVIGYPIGCYRTATLLQKMVEAQGAGPVRVDAGDHAASKDKIYATFADPTPADAICGRLFRGAIGITLKGESRRKANPPKVEHWIHPC